MFADAISALPGSALAQRQADAALKSLGFQTYEELAGKLNDAMLAMVSEAGFWQAYDATTGEGLGQEGAATTASLVLDLINTPYHHDRW